MPPVPLGQSATEDDKKTSEMIQRLAAARKRECPCDCYDLIFKLPAGYRIVRGEQEGFHAEWSGILVGLPLAWDQQHCRWGPPGFVGDAVDPDRWFNRITGQNAVWDDKKKQWIDAKTGKSLGYEQ